jgi:hypothetical protein
MFERNTMGNGTVPPNSSGNGTVPHSPQGNGPAAAAPKKVLYRCVENCTRDGLPYKQGETILLAGRKETVPHFVLVREE